MDKAKVDMIVETMRESIEPITVIFNETNENRKVSLGPPFTKAILRRIPVSSRCL